MEYKIIHTEEVAGIDVFEVLKNNVTHAISNGWKPQGGVAVVYNPQTHRREASQAMVREKEPQT